jgi:hypothetical protein
MEFDFKLHPNKPIYAHCLLWLAVFFPIFLAVAFSWPLMTNLTYDFTKEGYDLFLATFRLPLWLLSGAIVFGVIVARFHFSLQRSKSIEQSEKNLQESKRNNNFKMYYEHREVFNDFVKDIHFEIAIKQQGIRYVTCGELDIDITRAYSYFFSSNSPSHMHTDYTINDIRSSFFKITPENAHPALNEGNSKEYIKFTGTPFIFSFTGLRKYWPDIMKTGELKEIELLLIHAVYKVSLLIFEEFSSIPDKNIFMKAVENCVNKKYHALIGLEEDMDSEAAITFTTMEMHFMFEQVKGER